MNFIDFTIVFITIVGVWIPLILIIIFIVLEIWKN